MINKQTAFTLVFLGTIISANVYSNDRQTDEPLLANNVSLPQTQTEVTKPRTVSAIESRELREHYSKQINSTLTAKLDAMLEIQSTHVASN